MMSNTFLNTFVNFCVYCALPPVFLLQIFGSIFRHKKVSGNNDKIGKDTTVAVQPKSGGGVSLAIHLFKKEKQ
jgi:hypothetical protein